MDKAYSGHLLFAFAFADRYLFTQGYALSYARNSKIICGRKAALALVYLMRHGQNKKNLFIFCIG
jgi:hypothetical protein